MKTLVTLLAAAALHSPTALHAQQPSPAPAAPSAKDLPGAFGGTLSPSGAIPAAPPAGMPASGLGPDPGLGGGLLGGAMAPMASGSELLPLGAGTEDPATVGFQPYIGLGGIGMGGASMIEQAIIDEETSANPAAAAEKYRAIVATFDSRRAEAAQAVFRLGECLRRLGRIEEAKVQYARILREFVDQTELMNLSQKFLSATTPGNATAALELENFLEKDIALVREQIAATEARFRAGNVPASELIPLQRELLRLEQLRADFQRNGNGSYQFPLTPKNKVEDAIPQAQPVFTFLKAVKEGDQKQLKSAFSEKMRAQFDQEGWDKVLQRYQELFKTKFGDYKLEDFVLEYKGEEETGWVSIVHKGKTLPDLSVIKEKAGWKISEG